MNEEQSAAVAIKRFLQTIKGLAEIEPHLAEVGSLKQAASETSSRIVKLQGEESQLKAALAKAKDDIDAAKEEAKSVVLKAGDSASEIILKAEGEAKALLDKAKADITSDRNQAQKDLATVNQQIKAAVEQKKLLEAEAIEAEHRYDVAQRKLNEVVRLARAG